MEIIRFECETDEKDQSYVFGIIVIITSIICNGQKVKEREI